MASTTIATFDPALKQIYRPSNVENMVFSKRPFLGMLPKFEGFGGRNMPVVVTYGDPQGRSATFATAQSHATAIAMDDFVVTRVNDYSVATITGEVVEATRGDNMAFLQALKAKIDSAMNSLANAIETKLFRHNYGFIATLHATTAPTTANPMVLTLAQAEEITNFEVGMVLIADNNETGASPRATPASITIAGVNRSAGTITTGYDNSGPTTNWAVSDYLFVSGDESASMAGLQAWLPTAAEVLAWTTGTLFGVARAVDSRLLGIEYDGSADTLEDSAITGQSKAAREGGSPDTYLVANAQMRKLIQELGAKKQYCQIMGQSGKGGDAKVGYRGVLIDGDDGEIKVVACNKCQGNIGWMLSLPTWTLATLGPAVKMLMEDGLKILRQAAADGYEVRVGFRGNLCTKAPGHNVRITLATP